jgi:Transcriptional regulators
MPQLPHAIASGRRLRALLLHVPFYGFDGPARLAADAGISRATVSRLLNGRVSPSVRTAQAVADALALRSGRALCVADVFTPDGTFARSACETMNCRGCLPPEAWDERKDRLRPGWRHALPGQWSRSEPALPTA